eukprot:s90_g38.t1
MPRLEVWSRGGIEAMSTDLKRDNSGHVANWAVAERHPLQDLCEGTGHQKDPRMSEDPITDVKGRGGVVRSGYKPGHVLFGGHHFDRRDLLILHGRLLAKAHQSYTHPEHDEVDAEKMPASKSQEGVPLQHTLKGGQGAEGTAMGTMRPAASDEKHGYPPQKSGRGVHPSPRPNVANWRGFPAGSSLACSPNMCSTAGQKYIEILFS